ncbi:CBN-MCM-5 protein [Sesbania bispinosa]|nr:CBN-MCM-5 protein [Sesbania bispinosa]
MLPLHPDNPPPQITERGQLLNLGPGDPNLCLKIQGSSQIAPLTYSQSQGASSTIQLSSIIIDPTTKLIFMGGGSHLKACYHDLDLASHRELT